MKTMFQKTAALLLALLLIVTPLTVCAVDVSVTVAATVAQNNAFTFPYQSLTVQAGYAASLGYAASAANKVTAVDAVAAIHAAVYGEAFEDAPTDYLRLSEGGWISRFMGEDTYSVSYFVNHKYIMDENGMGLLLAQIVLQNNDWVEFFTYADPYWQDQYWFIEPETVTVTAGEDFTAAVKGFEAMQAYDSTLVPQGVANAEITAGSTSDAMTATGVTTDADGSFTLSFAEPGTYYVSAKTDGVYYIPPLCIVQVQPAPTVTLSETSLSLRYKQNMYLTAKANGPVVWTSSDPSVAVVDAHGRVTATGRGTATITAAIQGTDVSDSCDVEVYYSFTQWLVMIVLFGWIWYK